MCVIKTAKSFDARPRKESLFFFWIKLSPNSIIIGFGEEKKMSDKKKFKSNKRRMFRIIQLGASKVSPCTGKWCEGKGTKVIGKKFCAACLAGQAEEAKRVG